MPRGLPLGNGSLLVSFDRTDQIRETYWPHAGLENHAVGYPFRVGVWADDRFQWLNDSGWVSAYPSASSVTFGLGTGRSTPRAISSTSTIQMVHSRRAGIPGIATAPRSFGMQPTYISGRGTTISSPAQIHRYTGDPLSVSPLTWSHADLIAAVHACLRAQARLQPAADAPIGVTNLSDLR